jgi:tetratricopeptide (TPR) repeat protein
MPCHIRRLVAWFAVLCTGSLVLPLDVRAQAVARPAKESRAKSRSYAFLVAAQDYDGEEFRPLEYTRRDLEEFRQVLAASGFPADNIVFLHDKQKYRYLPLAENVRKELGLLLGRVEEGDTLVVAFSGHGVQLKPQGAKEAAPYFCPVDAKLREGKNLVGLDDLYRQLEGCRASRKLLLVDACRDEPLGKGERGLPQVSLKNLTGQKLAVPKGMAALFSCSAGERSFEQEELRHGVFFYHVIKGWRGAAADKDGKVTLEGLTAYAKRETKKYVSRKRRTLQRPYLRTSLEDEWVLHTLDRGLTDYRHARTAVKARRYDRAIARLDRAIARNPKLARAYDLRGSAFKRKGDYDRAAQDFAEAHRLDPKYSAHATELARAYVRRGLTYGEQEDYDRAAAEYTKAIRLDPKNAPAYKRRARAYRLGKKYDLAIADCSEALLLNPEDAAAYKERGRAYAAKGEHDLAVAEYTRAIDLQPKDAQLFCYRGDAHKAQEAFGRAVADYTKAVRLKPRYAVAFNQRGSAHHRLHQYVQAIGDFTKAIRLRPKDPIAYSNRGWSYLQIKDEKKAAADFRRAIRLAPKYAVAYRGRALAYTRQKNYMRAVRDCSRAIRLDPKYAGAYHTRGKAYERLRKGERAKADLATYRRLSNGK